MGVGSSLVVTEKNTVSGSSMAPHGRWGASARWLKTWGQWSKGGWIIGKKKLKNDEKTKLVDVECLTKVGEMSGKTMNKA
jgi:hypothetical protein